MTGARLAHLDDGDLGRAVGSLDVAWPRTPDVTGAVLDDIARGRGPRRRTTRTTLVILIAAAIVAIAAAAAAARFVFDVGAIAIRSVATLPALPPSPVEPHVVGQRATSAEAEHALGEPLPIPAQLGEPDVVWLRRDVTSFEPSERGVVVAMAWRPTRTLPRIPGTPYGATMFVFRGDEAVAVKSIDAPFHQLRRRNAVWIDAPHELDLYVHGRVRSFRVTGTVVIRKDGDLAVRLETALGRRAATRLAFAGT
jgi:hypothetical protein